MPYTVRDCMAQTYAHYAACLGGRPHLRRPEIVEEIEDVLTKWSKYGADLPRAARLELCKVSAMPAL